MKTLFLTIAIVLVSFQFQAQTITVSDREIPTEMTINEKEVKLNGTGIREKFFMDLYVGGLYLTNKSKDAQAIIKANEPMGIKIHIVSKLISSKKMIDAVEEGFENSTDGNQEQYREKINTFISFFKDEINKEDVFDIAYHPETGTTVYKNKSKKGSIKGLDFKKALFGIWLSDNPADDDLKEGMLNL
ncbi:chalcone isomerase family protein [Flavobacteriaceae bacterium 14752]|uniref:chalcone isomerase family protein n=1 Tax=Mesohalobacter salilacus TaxID=2491711 RepID=UPI000F642EB8|nr:chalcone isomerase [Flavobacteriaceae bacterium 14752]